MDVTDDLTLYSSPPPGSGAVLAYIVDIMRNYEDLSLSDVGDPVFHQRISESFKWGYARRSELGDPFDPDITDYVQDIVRNITSEEWAFDAW